MAPRALPSPGHLPQHRILRPLPSAKQLSTGPARAQSQALADGVNPVGKPRFSAFSLVLSLSVLVFARRCLSAQQFREKSLVGGCGEDSAEFNAA